METILRSVSVYALLLLFLRLNGIRTIAQITTFDFILLLLIGESLQQGLIGEDYSLTNALLTVLTLIGLDVLLSLVKGRSKTADKILDGIPCVLLENGRLLKDRLQETRVGGSDILAAARETEGLERFDQIKYAVLERDGKISIIPKRS